MKITTWKSGSIKCRYQITSNFPRNTNFRLTTIPGSTSNTEGGFLPSKGKFPRTAVGWSLGWEWAGISKQSESFQEKRTRSEECIKAGSAVHEAQNHLTFIHAETKEILNNNHLEIIPHRTNNGESGVFTQRHICLCFFVVRDAFVICLKKKIKKNVCFNCVQEFSFGLLQTRGSKKSAWIHLTFFSRMSTLCGKTNVKCKKNKKQKKLSVLS